MKEIFEKFKNFCSNHKGFVISLVALIFVLIVAACLTSCHSLVDIRGEGINQVGTVNTEIGTIKKGGK